MLLTEAFNYTKLSRKDAETGRVYVCPDGRLVPSVTTVLDKTKSEEKKQALQNWRKRVGVKEAAAITTAAAGRGTTMHKFLERYMLGEDIKPGSNLVQKQAFDMANVIIETMLRPNVTEIWGLETSLYFPGLYAGTTDCVGIWQGMPAIIDFKQTNKPKKEEWIEDYYLQLAAYATAHNEVYGTKIDQGVVLMCSGDLQGQTFVLGNNRFSEYADKWWDRVEQYYRER